MKNILIASALLLSFNSFAADVGLSPSSLKLAIYKFSVSTDQLCTNPITIIDNGDTPVEVDFKGGVKLGSGKIDDGTYPCIIIEFSDNIKFRPMSNSDSGNCLASTVEKLDVCRIPDTSLLTDGSTTSCTSSLVTGDRVAMYISTASTSTTGSDAFNPPTGPADAAHGFNLPTALVVSGSGAGKFVVNPAGQVCDGDDAACEGGGNPGTCQMGPPTFSFTQY